MMKDAATNRTARRLAIKNGLPVEVLLAMQRTGIVAPNERRIDIQKINAFKRAIKPAKVNP